MKTMSGTGDVNNSWKSSVADAMFANITLDVLVMVIVVVVAFTVNHLNTDEVVTVLVTVGVRVVVAVLDVAVVVTVVAVLVVIVTVVVVGIVRFQGNTGSPVPRSYTFIIGTAPNAYDVATTFALSVPVSVAGTSRTRS